jgi:hypothetical protein
MITLLLVFCLASTIQAQPPRLINYQGVLTDAGGAAVGDGFYSVTFRLYEVDAGGTEIWTETQAVEVNKGIFNVVLGNITPLDIPFDAMYWLGIAVEAEPELGPRVPLTSSAYSINSMGVTGYTNVVPPEGNVGIGTPTPAHPLHISTENMTGLRIDGHLAASWTNITVNAAGGASLPSYEYYRQNGYRARTFLDNEDDWHLQLGGDRRLSVSSVAGFVGIGIEEPLERLDVDGAIRLGTTGETNAGAIRWSGSDFEGYNGSAWQSLTATGGSLPAGSAGQTLRHNGSDWTANSLLYNDGTNIGIGTTNPQQALHVDGIAQFDLGSGQISMSTPGGWPGLIAFAPGGDRRDIVFDDNRMYLAASSSASAPPGTNGIILFESGQIGIGTNTPADKVHISDTGPTYVNIDAPSGFASGVTLSVDGTPEWSILYNPAEGTLQMYKDGSGPKMVIGDGGRVGINTTTLSGLEWLEVNNPNPSPGDAAITGYSYFNTSPSSGGGIAVAGIHSDDGVGGTGVYGEATDGGGMFDSQTGVYGYTDDGYGVYSDGTLGSTGPVVTLAATRDYGHRKVYAVQSAGNWFEDFGEGRLSAGEAVVEIDPVFAQTVTLSDQYHVFLTPLGDGGLYVAEKTDRHFVVRARNGSKDDIAFDYRIVAKRSGFESKRLEPARDPVEMRRRLGIPRADVVKR